ncbi:MAG TPA: nickel-dependent hydrogenase large subunit, partial [Ignavibacteria bacterium]
EIHPINVKIGGFYKTPAKKELLKLAPDIKWARDAVINLIKIIKTFEFPDFEFDYDLVALSHPDEYPMNEGKIISNRGLNILPEEYDFHFVEEHVEHSNALHSRIRERGSYMVGPLARYNLNYKKLSPLCRQTAKEAGLGREVLNPFKSILVRGIETLYACEEALNIIENYEEPEKPAVDILAKEATGYAATEAPRGLIYHRYRIDDEGIIADARIVPPTSQNQKQIENDLRTLIPKYINLPDKDLVWKCEQAVRNYDPCISCATHFLKLNILRE